MRTAANSRAAQGPLSLFGGDEVLLLTPGVCFAISNYVQHSAEMGGSGGFVHAVTGFTLLLTAFSLSIGAPLAARGLHKGWFAGRRIVQITGHAAIVAIGAPIQFFAIAVAVSYFRDELAFREVSSLASQSFAECLPAWIAVYAFLVAVDSRLSTARRRRWSNGAIDAVAATLAPPRLRFHADGADHFLDPAMIEQVRAMGDYVQIHAGRRRLTVKATMAEVETMLEPHGFARVHRGSLVCLRSLVAIERTGSGAYEAVLSSGERAPLSRRRLSIVRSAIGAAPGIADDA